MAVHQGRVCSVRAFPYLGSIEFVGKGRSSELIFSSLYFPPPLFNASRPYGQVSFCEALHRQMQLTVRPFIVRCNLYGPS
uniref:Uncharacterized protein n=2 Tax=Picea TaxID=3328 RepID=A0A101LZR9_PICGL|nr:hypothetical protein ABT39_MTgene5374 [Picea glauca]QHR90235.1 hypothetical protein Q903MT_gene4258 [Picea sitchensis]